MKKTAQTILVLIITALTGCRDNTHLALMMAQADSLLSEHPDSAYKMLTSMEPEVQTCPKRQRMRYELLRAKAQNKAFVDFTTDSVMQVVVDYYDHHGTPNERLMAHYLLGCTYRDMGEAPRAIDAYQTAVECADTTDNECDYATLANIYSQMADCFSKLLLYEKQTESLQEAYKIEIKAQLWNYAALDMCLTAGVMIMQSRAEQAESVLLRAKDLFEKTGNKEGWIENSTILINFYLENSKEINKAKILIETYEQQAKLYDNDRILAPEKRIFNYYKGHYMELIGQLDSAEYYYRKVYRDNMSPLEKDPMYRGLLRVYQQRHNADSIAKYAQLYCEANDSSIAITDRELTAKMAASYNYNRHLKEANVQQARAARTTNWLIITIAITLFIIIGALLIIKNYRRRRIEKQRELDCLMQEYADTCEALSIKHNEMEEQKLRDKTLIAVLEETLEHAKSETEQQKAKTEELKNEIEVLREQYEENLQTHSEKYEQLQSKLSILIQHGAIQRIENKARSFADSATAQRITKIAFDVHECVTEQEWEDITHHAQTHYPELMHDLSAHADISKQAVRVAVLVLLAIPPAGMANIMKVGLQRITNIKSEINMALFKDKSARTLLANIGKKYAVYPKPM